MISGRSNKAFKNVASGLISKMLIMILAFITRTLFIRTLGAQYTGVSSLYTNILSVLSLADLGMSNVLMFYLYKALKDDDKLLIFNLVQEFKKIYFLIIVLVLTVGLALIPVLGYIVESTLSAEEVIEYYLLYLINSIASYFVVYRTTVLLADQKSYIFNTIQTAATVIMYIAQSIYLLLFKDFFGYLLIQVLCTIGANGVLNKIALLNYPYLKGSKSKKTEKDLIKNNLRVDLLKNIKATFLFKISDTILDQTDSIIISVLFGTIAVGYYSNYFMLISYIVAIAGIIANGLVASFGNLNTEGDMERSYEMFRAALTAFSIFGIICTTCYACVVQDFIPFWVGEEYLMPYPLVISILAVFYLRMITNTVWMYRSAMGLFQQVQYVNIIAAGLNILFSIVLGKTIGISGVILATAISRILTSFWFEGKIVFRKLGKSETIYYVLQLRNFLICICCVIVSLLVCNSVTGDTVFTIFYKLLISFLISSAFVLIFYGKTSEFQTIYKKLKMVIKLHIN